MPKYIVTGVVTHTTKFIDEVNALNSDEAVKAISNKFSNAYSITIMPCQDAVVFVEVLSTKRNRKKREKRGFCNFNIESSTEISVGNEVKDA